MVHEPIQAKVADRKETKPELRVARPVERHHEDLGVRTVRVRLACRQRRFEDDEIPWMRIERRLLVSRDLQGVDRRDPLVLPVKEQILFGAEVVEDRLDRDARSLGDLARSALVPATDDRFDFGAADKVIEFARHHRMKVVGHTLCWHEQSPPWLFQGPGGGPLPRLLRGHHLAGRQPPFRVRKRAFRVHQEGREAAKHQ